MGEFEADYSETRDGVSRKHVRQVDATIRERQPCTKLNWTRQPWFRPSFWSMLRILLFSHRLWEIAETQLAEMLSRTVNQTNSAQPIVPCGMTQTAPAPSAGMPRGQE